MTNKFRIKNHWKNKQFEKFWFKYLKNQTIQKHNNDLKNEIS